MDLRSQPNDNAEVARRLRTVELTDKQYTVMLDVFHELNEVWPHLPAKYLDAFYRRLQARGR